MVKRQTWAPMRLTRVGSVGQVVRHEECPISLPVGLVDGHCVEYDRK